MSQCCYIDRFEAGCPSPPITDPGGGTVTDPPPSDGLWFTCAIPGGGCHHGIGFVRFYNGAGDLLYAGCPYTTGTNKTNVAFDASKLSYGSRVHVDYMHSSSTTREGLSSPCCCSHRCDRGRFNVGLGNELIGTANINNARENASNDGGPGLDRYNKFFLTNDVIDKYLAGLGTGGGGGGVPTGVTVTYMNQQRIVVTWNDKASSESAYRIDRSINFEPWITLSSTLAPNTTQYIDTAPPNGTAFGYNTRVAYRVSPVVGGTASDFAEGFAQTGLPPDPSSRQVCWIESNSCSLWIEAVRGATASVNYVPVGYVFATVPKNRAFRIALVNYATRGSSNTSQGAELHVARVSDPNRIIATYPLQLNSTGRSLSPFPFDGRSIDGVPFALINTFNEDILVKAGGGVPGYPGIYFDDSAAYQIL